MQDPASEPVEVLISQAKRGIGKDLTRYPLVETRWCATLGGFVALAASFYLFITWSPSRPRRAEDIRDDYYEFPSGLEVADSDS